MALTLPNIRYFTAASPYHYTEDNKPLSDLASRDVVLAQAIDQLNTAYLTGIAAGNWASLQVKLDLTQEQGKPFAYRVRTWAIEDQSIAASQNASFFDDIVMGYNTIGGTVTITGINSNLSFKVGTPVLTRTITPSGNFLGLTFAGYSGANGYAISKVDRFGT